MHNKILNGNMTREKILTLFDIMVHRCVHSVNLLFLARNGRKSFTELALIKTKVPVIEAMMGLMILKSSTTAMTSANHTISPLLNRITIATMSLTFMIAERIKHLQAQKKD